MKSLLIVNDPPYGTERCYNALRLAHALLKKDATNEVNVFLMADAVVAGRAGARRRRHPPPPHHRPPPPGAGGGAAEAPRRGRPLRHSFDPARGGRAGA